MYKGGRRWKAAFHLAQVTGSWVSMKSGVCYAADTLGSTAVWQRTPPSRSPFAWAVAFFSSRTKSSLGQTCGLQSRAVRRIEAMALAIACSLDSAPPWWQPDVAVAKSTAGIGVPITYGAQAPFVRSWRFFYARSRRARSHVSSWRAARESRKARRSVGRYANPASSVTSGARSATVAVPRFDRSPP